MRPSGGDRPVTRRRTTAGGGAGHVAARVLTLALPLALLAAGSARAQPDVDASPRPVRACPTGHVSVQTAHPDTVAVACAGAADALAFLSWLSRSPDDEIRIEAVDRLPAGLRPDAVGCYAVQSRRLMVLEHPLFLARGTWFEVPVSTALWRAVVAHEVAHALVGCHLAGRPLPPAAHEYVAYVTMFATMDPATREAALAALPGRGFDHDAEINDLRDAFDPMRFGVESYRHWLRQPDGRAFLRSVVTGSVVPDPSF